MNAIGPAGLALTGKNSRVPKLLVKNRLKLARTSSKEAVAVKSPGRFHSRIVRGKKEL